MADRTDGLLIIDVSNPTNPITLGTLADVGNAWDCWVEGGYIYIVDSGHYLNILEI